MQFWVNEETQETTGLSECWRVRRGAGRSLVLEEVSEGVRTLAGEAAGVREWDTEVCTVKSGKVLGSDKLWGMAEEGLGQCSVRGPVTELRC